MSILLEKSKILKEIVQTFIALIPVFVVGAFTLVIQYFPVEAVADFVKNAWDGALYMALNYLYDATYGMVSIYILVILSFRYSVSLTKSYSNINIYSVIATLVSYFILIGGETLENKNGESIKVLLLNCTNERNIFVAVLVAFISTVIVVKVNSMINKQYAAVRIKADFTRTFKGLIPMLVTWLLFISVMVVVRLFTPYNHLGDLLKDVISMPFGKIGQSLLSGIGLIILQGVTWFFGIHGSNTFKDVAAIVFPDGSGAIFSKTFLDTYAVIGGAGMTIALIIIGLCIRKEKGIRNLAFTSIVPSIFNINEIIIFGLPIVLNPVFIIPFTVAPVVSFLMAYFATSVGWVPVVVNTVNWTTPPIISGYLATDSWKGAVLQIIVIIVSILIYYPFVKMYIRIQKKIEDIKMVELVDYMKEAEKNNEQIVFSELPDSLIRVVANLGQNLCEDIDKGNVFMYYQPQLDNNENVVSAEALLRWKGRTDKIIYPPLVVAIAKEYKVYGKMTRQIIVNAIADIKKVYEATGKYLPIAINIDVNQLVDEDFVNWIIGVVKESNIPDNTLDLEITEQANLVEKDNFSEIIEKYRANGILVSIDDFSMGYTSMAYLQMNQFDYIKLDGGIVKNMEKNERSKEIVDSLISLGKNLGFEVVAEYVENESLKNMLQDMGCHKYQGYLYSPAVELDNYIEYIKKTDNISGK